MEPRLRRRGNDRDDRLLRHGHGASMEPRLRRRGNNEENARAIVDRLLQWSPGFVAGETPERTTRTTAGRGRFNGAPASSPGKRA